MYVLKCLHIKDNNKCPNKCLCFTCLHNSRRNDGIPMSACGCNAVKVREELNRTKYHPNGEICYVTELDHFYYNFNYETCSDYKEDWIKRIVR